MMLHRLAKNLSSAAVPLKVVADNVNVTRVDFFCTDLCKYNCDI